MPTTLTRPLAFVIASFLVSALAAVEADSPKDTPPAQNNVTASFNGLAEATVPEYSWNENTAEEHTQWKREFREKMLGSLGRMPERVPLEVKWVEKREFDTFTRHKIYIQTEKTYWCPVYYLVPHNIKGRVPAIVCLHGHDGAVPYLGEGRKPDQTRPVLARDFARYFAENGYVAIVPVVRGWDETVGYQDPYGGKSTQRSCMNVTMNSILLGMSPAGIRCWDAMRAIDFLETQDMVDAEKIGLAGLSGGGTLSLYLPILDERIKLVMMAGIFSSYRNSFYAMNHCICNTLPGVMQYGEMSDVVALHAPRPVLLINGLRDESVPIDDARAGFEKLKRVYSLLNVPENVEADFFDGPHEWSNAKSLGFVKRHFGE
ncbi:MAG: alpha/beta hydrolase family protein [Planctomycetaceae bacterium]